MWMPARASVPPQGADALTSPSRGPIIGAMWPLGFDTPLALLLAPAAVLAFVRWRRRSDALTLAAVLCLAVAAAGPQWRTERRRTARVYLLDASGSMFLDLRAALDGVRQSMGELAPQDRAGLVLFGRSPVLALPMTEVRALPDRIEPPPDLPRPDGSDLAAAIRLAARQLAEPGYDRQIVLLSDGRYTSDAATVEAALAADAGLRIIPIPVGPAGVADARVTRLDAPLRVRQLEPFRITIGLAATAAIETDLVLQRGDQTIATRRVTLEPGVPRRLVATDTLVRPGPVAYTARLTAADRCTQNNVARAAVRAQGATRFLYLSNTTNPPLLFLLGNMEGSHIPLAQPRGLRLDRQRLADVDCLVLDRVPAADLSDAAQRAIRDWVRDAAGGLIALGGPDAYGPGGYLDTPVEEALPVLCDRPRPLALVVALDASGSMAERAGERRKIAYAREAVLATLDRLRFGDRLGVVAFAAQPDLRLPLTQGASADRLRAILNAIEPHGGTDLNAALDLALRVLPQGAADLRHVILLSDGQDPRFDPAALRRRFAEAGTGLSVLVTGGEEEAVARLRQLAPDDFHHVTDPAALPAIFRRVLLKATHREQVRRGSFPVRPVSAELAKGIRPAGPLAGYVRVIARPEAAVEWQTGDGDPVLARWRFGLGRAVAFASTVGADWDAGFLARADAFRLWARAARWAARPADAEGFEAEAETDGDRLVLTVRAADGERFHNGLDLAARIMPPRGDAIGIPLLQVAPGEYRGEADAPVEGIYAITVAERDAPCLAIGYARNYAREWEAFGIHRPTLDALARNGRGTVLPGLASLRTLTPAAAPTDADIAWPFVLAALLLFLASVARSVLATRTTRL